MSAGKGSSPRNCFSKQYKDNYDSINWNHKKPNRKKPDKYTDTEYREPECEHCGRVYCDCPNKY